MDKQKVIDLVQKMLNLARDKGASQGERDNAMSAVHKYLAKYNLDLATVEGTQSQSARKKEESDGGPRTHHIHQFFGRPWAVCAAGAVAELCFCMYLYASARQSKDCRHYFVGRTANAVTAAYLAEFVAKSIHTEGRKRQRQEGHDNPWFLSFAWGAALEVQKRVKILKDSSANQRQSGSGKELVLASVYDNERTENQKYKQVAFPRTRVMGVRGKGIRNKEGYESGSEYGKTINLDRQLG